MKNVKALVFSVFVAITALVIATPYAHATLDLTTAGSSGFLNDAYFVTSDSQSTGTGTINSFVRLQTNDNVEEGYNTSGRALLFDENNSPVFTKDLLLSQVPVVSLLNQNNQSTLYRQFLLDINQQSCGPNKPNCTNKFLSLDSLNIYLGSTGGLLKNNPDDLGTSVFKLTADNIKLNYDLNSGSGSGDMFAYIPDAFFTGTNQYVYLYSKFGEQYANNAGFEEWATLSRPITVTPEPASMVLFGSGLLTGIGAFLRKKRA